MAEILTVTDLKKVYGKGGSLTRALDGVSLSLEAGEFVGVMGPSGSGKTTLLNCVSTIDSPTSGSIVIEGPCGTLELKEGVIIARNHIHVTAPDSIMFDLRDKQRVDVALLTERPVVLRDVLIRVSTRFSCKMHIDFDEANAALVKGFTLGRIIR